MMESQQSIELEHEPQLLINKQSEFDKQQTTLSEPRLHNLLFSMNNKSSVPYNGTNEQDITPPKDERYLKSDEFYYTASFQARPRAEHFDFDTADNIEEQDVSRDQADDSHFSNFYQDEQQPAYSQVATDEDADDEASHIQDIIDRLSVFKQEFHELIKRMDYASLASSHSRQDQRPLEVSQPPSLMSKVVDDVVLSLHDLLPKSRCPEKRTGGKVTKLPKTEKRGPVGTSGPVGASGFLQTLSSASLEDDPCANLPNFGVVLIKSPASVSQLWDEYTKLPSEWPIDDLFSFTLQQQQQQHGSSNGVGANIETIIKRRTTIQDLERKYGSSWRNNDKNFSRQINRRKKMWCAIEDGLRDGLKLEECFLILEDYVRERGKGLSWYYNGVPFKLPEMKTKKS